MSLSVITLTRDLRTPSLQACKESVAKALFPGAKHEVVLCPKLSEFNQVRYDSSTMDEYTAIVDDDDTIPEDSLKLCYAAMKLYDLDMVFTDELQLSVRSGNINPSRTGSRRFEDVTLHPQTIHHLVMMRSSLIDKKCIEFANLYCAGIDWFMHASVALRGKVMHLPKFGYTWSRHDDQHSVVTRKTYNYHFENIKRSIIESWGERKGVIPQVDITEVEAFIAKNKW